MPLLQPRLNLKVSQRQILTPGLMQMVSVLALNKLELTEMINAEMVENPVLEEIDETVPTLDEIGGREALRDRVVEEPPVTEKDPFEEIDFGSYFQDYLDPGFKTSQEYEELDKPSFEHFLSQPTTLTDHLTWQLGALVLDDHVREAAEFLIGNLDENGYLSTPLLELAGLFSGAEDREPTFATSLAVLQSALELVQNLDPAGVGALNLCDCLLIQLKGQLRELELVFVRQPPDRTQAAESRDEEDFDQAAVISPTMSSLLVEEQAEHVLNGHGAGSRNGYGPGASSNYLSVGEVGTCTTGTDADSKGDVDDYVLSMPEEKPGRNEHSGHVPSQREDADDGVRQSQQDSPHHSLHAEAEAVLEERRQTFNTAKLICNGHLAMLQKCDLKEIGRAVGRPVAEVNSAIELIRTLDPRPGRRYSREQTRLIEPDVAFVKRGDTWVVAMNEEDMPTLRLSQRYRRMLVAENTDKEVKEYVKERFRSAMQLMRNIAQRKSTILRTCEVIVRRQQEFLDVGIEALRPMMIKEVAEEIGVHPSTVSRAVANKYAHTPQGVIELRFFFSEGANGPEGADTPLVVLKRKVRKLIEDENPRHPLTDDQLAAVLQGQGIQVTRRTVAKYREDLHIPSTHQRRRRQA